MRRTIKARMLSATAIAVMLGAVGFAAPALAYNPGAANVKVVTYNATTGNMNWGCTYTGWVAAAKYYGCEQWDADRTYIVVSHTGSWSGASLSKSYQNPDNVNWYAYKAYAGYNDGSGSASNWRWG